MRQASHEDEITWLTSKRAMYRAENEVSQVSNGHAPHLKMRDRGGHQVRQEAWEGAHQSAPSLEYTRVVTTHVHVHVHVSGKDPVDKASKQTP